MVSKRARASNTLGTRLGAIQEGVATLEAKTRTPADDGSSARLAYLEEQIALLGSANYRVEQERDLMGTDWTQGILDENYVGPGPARVYMLDDMASGLSATAYEWEGEYQPWGCRVVNLRRVYGGDGYVIAGHNYQTKRSTPTELYMGGKIALSLTAACDSYNRLNRAQLYSEPAATRLPSGIVQLEGLITVLTVASGTVLFTLPPGYRPDTAGIFPVLSGSVARTITIGSNGDVSLRAGHTATFINLDGIAFPAAGVATWSEVGVASGFTFAGTWANHSSSATFGPCAAWKDPYGLVWFRGLIQGGNTTTDNNVMINLPTGYRVPTNMGQHMIACGGDLFGFVGAMSAGNGLQWKNGTTVSTFVSLAGVTLMTQECFDHGTWWAQPFGNAWANYGSSFTTQAVTRRLDGMGLSRGLINTGTVGQAALRVPKHMWPEQRALILRPSAAATGRMDLYSIQSGDDGGQAIVNTGVNSWFSMDSMKWIVGR